MAVEIDYGAMIFDIAKRGADKHRIKFALERARSLRSHLAAEKKRAPNYNVENLVDAIDQDVAYIERLLMDVAATK